MALVKIRNTYVCTDRAAFTISYFVLNFFIATAGTGPFEVVCETVRSSTRPGLHKAQELYNISAPERRGADQLHTGRNSRNHETIQNASNLNMHKDNSKTFEHKLSCEAQRETRIMTDMNM